MCSQRKFDKLGSNTKLRGLTMSKWRGRGREGGLIVEITVAIVLENDKIAMVRKSLLIDIATLQPTKESN